MTENDDTPPAPAAPAPDTWEGILDVLRRRYPGQKDSVLFCIYKLQQNPDITLRDFKDEAVLYGIPLAGRALHSARGILGFLREVPTRAPTAPAAAYQPHRQQIRERRQRQTEAAASGDSIEQRVLAALQQVQTAAGAEADSIRQAVREAIVILQRAIGD